MRAEWGISAQATRAEWGISAQAMRAEWGISAQATRAEWGISAQAMRAEWGISAQAMRAEWGSRPEKSTCIRAKLSRWKGADPEGASPRAPALCVGISVFAAPSGFDARCILAASSPRALPETVRCRGSAE
jgi:hypothetical protein